jgi:hypothetical protein
MGADGTAALPRGRPAYGDGIGPARGRDGPVGGVEPGGLDGVLRCVGAPGGGARAHLPDPGAVATLAGTPLVRPQPIVTRAAAAERAPMRATDPVAW